MTQLIESVWTQYEPTISPNNLNLDEIFSFLQGERGLESKGGKNENKTLDEITDELNELNTLLSEDMVSPFVEIKKIRLCVSRLAPVLITIFHQSVIAYTCSQSNSDGS